MLKTIREAAAYLHTTPRRVRALVKAGKLRLVHIDAKWRIDEADLELFVTRMKV